MATQTDETIEAASELFRCLASPIRVTIIVALAEQPMCVHEVVRRLDVAQPLVSQHLRILRQNRLVVGEREGREMKYRLADQHVSAIVSDAIEHVGCEPISE